MFNFISTYFKKEQEKQDVLRYLRTEYKKDYQLTTQNLNDFLSSSDVAILMANYSKK